MIPILYDKNEKSFTNNGIGRLSDVISCTVTEVKNGEYSLEMEYPSTGKYFEELEEERIIYAKPNDGDGPQPFTIFRISKPIRGVVAVSANHSSYLLNKMIVMPFQAETCQEALSMIPANVVGGTNFTFWTDKSVIGTFKNETPRAVRGMLGGEQGSILQTYGKGEYEFDHFAVKLHVNRGMDRGVTIRYGKNIIDLENTLDMSNVYTGIVPYWRSEDDILTLPEKVVWSNYTGMYAYNLTKDVDFSGEWQDKPSVGQLRERAQKYITDNEGWVLPQNITLSFVHLADTEEYKDIAPLERVRLCDTVTIIDTPLGVNLKAKVIKTVYNTLLERYESIEIGETQPNLKTVIEEQIREPIIQATSTRMQQAIKYATDLITGVKGGYLIINTDDNGTPTELLIMNNPDKNLATQVLRINMNGIGFGKSYKGPFTTAWTLDGHFVANYIDTGTLNADLIRTGILRALNNSRNFWNMLTGEFHLRSDNATTGIDYANGVLNINASAIRSGTLDASVANITNINASNIKSGSMSANYISGGTIDASKVNVANINASNIKTGTLSANLVRSGVLQSNNRRVYFDLNNSRLVCTSSDGRIVSTFSDGTLHARASGYRDIQIQVYSSILNQLTLNGPLYANSTALFDSTVHAEGNITTSSGVQAYGNINAGMDMSAQNLHLVQKGYAQEFVNQSDRDRKKNIVKLSLDKAKDFIMRLVPKKYKYKSGGNIHHGFIAQDIKEIIEEKWDVYTEYEDAEGKTCGIGYTEIIADLVAVVQDQERRIAELEGKLA